MFILGYTVKQYEIKNKAAIALQCKLNGKLIAAVPYLVLFEDVAPVPVPKMENCVVHKTITTHVSKDALCVHTIFQNK